MTRLAGSVRAISGPPSRQTANRRRRSVAPLGRYIPHIARLWPAYLMRHGLFLASLILSNEKACTYSQKKMRGWISGDSIDFGRILMPFWVFITGTDSLIW